MRKLDLAVRAHRFLEALPPKQFRQVVAAVLALLREPYPHDSSKLQGHPYYRIDVGEYRVIYRAESDFAQVMLIGMRNDGPAAAGAARSERQQDEQQSRPGLGAE